jgi:hypothetical protein
LGEIAWTGPLLLVMARPVLFVLIQAALAAVFALLHRPSAWRTFAGIGLFLLTFPVFMGGSFMSSVSAAA